MAHSFEYKGSRAQILQRCQVVVSSNGKELVVSEVVGVQITTEKEETLLTLSGNWLYGDAGQNALLAAIKDERECRFALTPPPKGIGTYLGTVISHTVTMKPASVINFVCTVKLS